jgi:hypothetical protein
MKHLANPATFSPCAYSVPPQGELGNGVERSPVTSSCPSVIMSYLPGRDVLALSQVNHWFAVQVRELYGHLRCPHCRYFHRGNVSILVTNAMRIRSY